jgi:Flp pilus assembly pilin Flp
MKTGRFLARFWDDQSGVAAEYVVILALVGSALVASVTLLSGALVGGISDATSCINGTTCP